METTDAARTLAGDVRALGDLLGETLAAHGGEGLLADVEEMRLAAKGAREADDEATREAARAELAEVAARLDARGAGEVVRAFGLYFQLVNLAEDVARTRVLRQREAEGPDAVDESLAACVTELHGRGATGDEVLAALGDLHLRFVFTAHPTEARRRTTERLLALARRALVDLDRRRLTPWETEATLRRLRAAVEALWEHADERHRPPEVLDEVRTGLWYFDTVLLDALPELQRRLAAAVSRRYGEVDPARLPLPVGFGSWMGGDRDGNPFVDAGTTEEALRLHRRLVLGRYLHDLGRLADPLAAAAVRLPASPALDAALDRAGRALGDDAAFLGARNPAEPLRRLLTFMRARLERAQTSPPGPTRGPRPSSRTSTRSGRPSAGRGRGRSPTTSSSISSSGCGASASPWWPSTSGRTHGSTDGWSPSSSARPTTPPGTTPGAGMPWPPSVCRTIPAGSKRSPGGSSPSSPASPTSSVASVRRR